MLRLTLENDDTTLFAVGVGVAVPTLLAALSRNSREARAAQSSTYLITRVLNRFGERTGSFTLAAIAIGSR